MRFVQILDQKRKSVEQENFVTPSRDFDEP